MTTPLKNETYHSESESEEEGLEMAEYDLEVVDDALLNPNSSEYLDHFGFKIQVRTDDEDSSDDDSDYNSSDDEVDKHKPNVSLSTTTTATSDDDSIDTNLTTPHLSQHEQHQKWLADKTQSLENYPTFEHHEEKKVPDIKNSSIPILKPPPSPKNQDASSTDIKSPPTTARNSVQRPSLEKDTPTNNRYSILSSFNLPFNRPSSIASNSSPSAAIHRPSQSYQQRQSKRFSQMTNIRSSTVINNTNKVKPKRFSHTDHQYDSENHRILKEEALAELKIYQEKDSTRYNWDFWSLAIQDFGRVFDSQIDDLRHNLTRGGIPSPIRGLVWQIIAKSHDSVGLETEYKEIVKKSKSPFEKQIQRDLTRTFPNHPFFMQEAGRQALYNVAKAYSVFDQEVGYCQGLAFIIGCLLLHMSEENAFCVLIKLMGKYGLRGHFTPRMETLHQHMYQFDNVFQQKLPVIHRHMEAEGVTPSMYASQWFITLFSYRCPIEISFRVIDLLLVEGSQILIQIALALITRNQEKILKLKFESLIEFLCHGVFEVFGEDGDGFMEDVYRVELPAKFMALLAQQYTGEEENRDSRSISQEDNLRRINGQLSEHIRSVESQLQVLRVENKDITQQIIQSKMDSARNEEEKQQLRHELTRVKAEFEKYKQDMAVQFQEKMNELVNENRKLEASNSQLASQLTDTEAMLIEMKMSFAERENDFETLKRQLKEARK